jgi:murein DD-endopeptidase MepM/ murein hydrolase activator NlpD
MAPPALQAAGAVLGERQIAPRLAMAAAAAALAMLMLIAAPLALLTSSESGSGEIAPGDEAIPAALVPVFNEASRVFAVNAYLLASVADQESTFGTVPGWRSVNTSGCVGLMQICVGGAGGDSWTPSKDAYQRGHRPASYAFQTTDHPNILDSFDSVMAAAVHLRGKVGGRPIPQLDDLAYRALCGYYGACSDGIAGNYAADVLARAKSWEREQATPSTPAVPPFGAVTALAWPVHGPVTSPFCQRRAWEACHPGVDIGVASGTTILAAADGRVVLVQSTESSGGYGNFTCLQHTSALSTCYAHQERILVHVGETVSRGQPIGISDCTGRCYGPHLHFEVRLDGRVVCPAPYLGESPRSMCAPGAPTA